MFLKNTPPHALKKTLMVSMLASTVALTGCWKDKDKHDDYILPEVLPEVTPPTPGVTPPNPEVVPPSPEGEGEGEGGVNPDVIPPSPEGEGEGEVDPEVLPPEPVAMKDVTFASFNVSFAVDTDSSESFYRWVGYMDLNKDAQDSLIADWHSNTGGSPERRSLAERVIQIRNIAAIIQKVRPDVLLMNEFNNDGVGINLAAMDGFQKNYLAHPQSMNSVDGGDLLEPIQYPYTESYATNTGELPDGKLEFDLDNNGVVGNLPGDAYGFGYYHGQYAFGLYSKYEIDVNGTHTFKNYKWKDLPGATIPTIECHADGSTITGKTIPDGMACGDDWYTEAEWDGLRLSSKNHVHAPIKIPTKSGEDRIIHALLSHPTPPMDGAAAYNTARNGAENKLWALYLDGAEITDDNGVSATFPEGDFVLMGDLNADLEKTPGSFNGFGELMNHPRINQDVSIVEREFTPVSEGAMFEPNNNSHPFPETRTSTFGSRADYALPSFGLPVVDTGVYWAAEGEPGRLLFNDPRIGQRGADKEVSSDHRLVWVTFQVEE